MFVDRQTYRHSDRNTLQPYCEQNILKHERPLNHKNKVIINDDKDGDWLESTADERPELDVHLCMRRVMCHVYGVHGLQYITVWKKLH